MNDPLSAGKGSKSVNHFIPFIAAYGALGYSLKQISSTLQSRHGFKRNAPLTTVQGRVQEMVDDYFGGWRNLRRLFITPIFYELDEAGVKFDKIVELYEEYFSRRVKKPFYPDIFEDLVSRGYYIGEIFADNPTMWHIHGMSYKSVVKNYMKLEYPLLKPRNPNQLVRFLQYKVMLNYLYDKLSTVEIAKKFHSPKPGVEHMYDSTVSSILKDFSGFPTISELLIAHDIDRLRYLFLTMSESSIDSGIKLGRVLHISRGAVWTRCNLFIDESKLAYIREPDTSRIRLAQISVIGPELVRSFRNKLTDEQIVEKIGFFTTVGQVKEWTAFLFRTKGSNRGYTTNQMRELLEFNPNWFGPTFWNNNWAIDPNMLIIR